MKAFLLLSLLTFGCYSVSDSRIPSHPEEEIQKVMIQQMTAWNRGDIEGYMDGYDRSDELTFASGGNITKGWKETLDRYKKHYDTRDKMGSLRFEDFQFFPMSEDSVLVLGKWTLVRDKDKPWGLFSLLFRKKSEGWRIILDHTSLATNP